MFANSPDFEFYIKEIGIGKSPAEAGPGKISYFMGELFNRYKDFTGDDVTVEQFGERMESIHHQLMSYVAPEKARKMLDNVVPDFEGSVVPQIMSALPSLEGMVSTEDVKNAIAFYNAVMDDSDLDRDSLLNHIKSYGFDESMGVRLDALARDLLGERLFKNDSKRYDSSAEELLAEGGYGNLTLERAKVLRQEAMGEESQEAIMLQVANPVKEGDVIGGKPTEGIPDTGGDSPADNKGNGEKKAGSGAIKLKGFPTSGEGKKTESIAPEREETYDAGEAADALNISPREVGELMLKPDGPFEIVGGPAGTRRITRRSLENYANQEEFVAALEEAGALGDTSPEEGPKEPFNAQAVQFGSEPVPLRPEDDPVFGEMDESIYMSLIADNGSIYAVLEESQDMNDAILNLTRALESPDGTVKRAALETLRTVSKKRYDPLSYLWRAWWKDAKNDTSTLDANIAQEAGEYREVSDLSFYIDPAIESGITNANVFVNYVGSNTRVDISRNVRTRLKAAFSKALTGYNETAAENVSKSGITEVLASADQIPGQPPEPDSPYASSESAQPPGSPEFIGFDDIMEVLEVDEDSLKYLISQGELGGFRDGDEIKFRTEHVYNLKRNREVEPTTAQDDLNAFETPGSASVPGDFDPFGGLESTSVPGDFDSVDSVPQGASANMPLPPADKEALFVVIDQYLDKSDEASIITWLEGTYGMVLTDEHWIRSAVDERFAEYRSTLDRLDQVKAQREDGHGKIESDFGDGIKPVSPIEDSGFKGKTEDHLRQVGIVYRDDVGPEDIEGQYRKLMTRVAMEKYFESLDPKVSFNDEMQAVSSGEFQKLIDKYGDERAREIESAAMREGRLIAKKKQWHGAFSTQKICDINTIEERRQFVKDFMSEFEQNTENWGPYKTDEVEDFLGFVEDDIRKTQAAQDAKKKKKRWSFWGKK